MFSGLTPFDNLRAFTFQSYSFKWHCNLCPSIRATVRSLQMSSLLPSDLSFSFLISRFLHERSWGFFIFKSIAGPFLFQFSYPSLSHRKCSLRLPLSVWCRLQDPVTLFTQSDFPSLLKCYWSPRLPNLGHPCHCHPVCSQPEAGNQLVDGTAPRFSSTHSNHDLSHCECETCPV